MINNFLHISITVEYSRELCTTADRQVLYETHDSTAGVYDGRFRRTHTTVPDDEYDNQDDHHQTADHNAGNFCAGQRPVVFDLVQILVVIFVYMR